LSCPFSFALYLCTLPLPFYQTKTRPDKTRQDKTRQEDKAFKKKSAKREALVIFVKRLVFWSCFVLHSFYSLHPHPPPRPILINPYLNTKTTTQKTTTLEAATTDIPTDATAATTAIAPTNINNYLQIDRLTQTYTTENEDGFFDYREYNEQESDTQEKDDNPLRTTLLTMLSNFARHAIHAPLKTFHTFDLKRDAARRIKQATVAPSLKTAAQRIADAIGNEPKADRPTLDGLISDCAKKQTTTLELKIMELRNQLNAQQRNNPVPKTPINISKNFRGSSNLIWNRSHPSRNSSNPAPAGTQRFHCTTTRSNTQITQKSTIARTPQSTINQSMTIAEAAPNTLNEPVRKQIQNRNQYQATARTQTVNSPNAQPLPKDSEATN
jgi:hypothetical protein